MCPKGENCDSQLNDFRSEIVQIRKVINGLSGRKFGNERGEKCSREGRGKAGKLFFKLWEFSAHIVVKKTVARGEVKRRTLGNGEEGLSL